MDFDLNEDQEMLKAVAERFVSDRYDMERRRQYLGHENGFSADNWACLGDLGLIGAPFSTESGGMGAGRADLAVLFEALGRGCVVEPLMESAVIAGGLFDRAAGPALRAAWLASLVSGDRRLAVAHREARMRGAGDPLRARRDPQSGMWRLNGDKSFLPVGGGADGYIVSAAVSDGATEFFLVPAAAAGLTIGSFRLIDGGVGVALKLRDVDVSDDHRLPGAVEAFENVRARAAIASAAEMVGLMEMMFGETLEYLRTRQQFGVPLGSFQALQHRMVAQYAALEQARALLDLAVMTDADVAASGIAIAGMRAFIAEAGATFGHEMVQLHGAMGVTDELIIGQAHKRLMFLSRYPDGAIEALDRYAA